MKVPGSNWFQSTSSDQREVLRHRRWRLSCTLQPTSHNKIKLVAKKMTVHDYAIFSWPSLGKMPLEWPVQCKDKCLICSCRFSHPRSFGFRSTVKEKVKRKLAPRIPISSVICPWSLGITEGKLPALDSHSYKLSAQNKFYSLTLLPFFLQFVSGTGRTLLPNVTHFSQIRLLFPQHKLWKLSKKDQGTTWTLFYCVTEKSKPEYSFLNIY